LRALRSTNAESLGHTEHSIPEGKRVRLEAGRTEEAVAHHGCSRPGELHKETAGQVVGRMATVDQEAGHMGTAGEAVGHTVAAGRRTGREAGEAVAHKAKEPVQGRHKVKEIVQVVHRRAREHPVQAVHHKAREHPVREVHHMVTGLVQVVHRAMAMGHCRAVAGKVIDWVGEDQKAELAEKVPLLLRSKSRMHLSCQPGPRRACHPSACRPWASHPWAYRRR
jgi:hypothetical protein